MLRTALFLLLASPALACDCRDVPALQIGVDETLKELLRRGSWHDDPTSYVALEAEVIGIADARITEVYGSESAVVTRSVMRLLVLKKTYDAFGAAPLSGGVVTVVGGTGANCVKPNGGFAAGAKYRFVLEPNPYVSGSYRVPLCGVYSEAVK